MTDLKTWVGNEMQVYQHSVAEFNVYAFKTKLIKYENDKKIFRNPSATKALAAHVDTTRSPPKDQANPHDKPRLTPQPEVRQEELKKLK